MATEKTILAPNSIISEKSACECACSRSELHDVELDEIAGGALTNAAQKWWDKNYKKVKKQVGADEFAVIMDELTDVFLDSTKHSLKFLKNKLTALGVDIDEL